MATIVQRGNSYSVVYMATIQGERKQRWETYQTREEAERRKQILLLCAKSKQKKVINTVKTVQDLLERYVLLYGSVKWSLSTFQSNQGLIRNYITPLFGTVRLEELSPRLVAELYGDFLVQPRCENRYHRANGQRVTVATLGSIHKLLHSVFENAVLWELVERNPFHRAVLPTAAYRKQLFLLPNQIEQLLKNCRSGHLELAIHLAFAGTLRKGELLALTWEDIDWVYGSVRVEKTLERVSRESLTYLQGKNVLFEFPPVLKAKKTALVLKTPKTRSGYRTVYLPETVMQLLRLEHQQQMPIAEERPNLVFCYPGGRPLQEHRLNQQLRELTDQLGLPPITFHSLRHSSISYKLILTCGNIKSVQKDAGHAQAEMVTEVYSHIWDENRRDNAQRFEEQFYQNGTLGN